MPTICTFDGIKITMYYRDHLPPHFHAQQGEEEAEIGIDPILILEGDLSRSLRAKIFQWAAIHQAELRANWELPRWTRRHMLVHIKQARVIGPHSLELTFDDGTVKCVNLRPELYGTVFEPLRDPKYFAQVFVENGTVSWPNGADFAPDFLYRLEQESSPSCAD